MSEIRGAKGQRAGGGGGTRKLFSREGEMIGFFFLIRDDQRTGEQGIRLCCDRHG